MRWRWCCYLTGHQTCSAHIIYKSAAVCECSFIVLLTCLFIDRENTDPKKLSCVQENTLYSWGSHLDLCTPSYLGSQTPHPLQIVAPWSGKGGLITLWLLSSWNIGIQSQNLHIMRSVDFFFKCTVIIKTRLKKSFYNVLRFSEAVLPDTQRPSWWSRHWGWRRDPQCSDDRIWRPKKVNTHSLP